MNYLLWACLLGTLSAVSLPLGSWIGLRYKFSSNQISILAAFGAGALFAALSVELVAPTVLALVSHEGTTTEESLANFFALVIGCVGGGFLYVLLDNLVNKHGGFLRKKSTLLRYYRRRNKKQQETMLSRISAIPLFHNFPPEHIDTLLSLLELEIFKDGEVLISEGSPAEELFVVVEGSVAVSLRGEQVDEIGPGAMVTSMISMVSNAPNAITGTAQGKTTVLKIGREAFQALREMSPEFDEACRKHAVERLESFEQILSEKSEEVLKWVRNAKDTLTESAELPSFPLVRKLEEEHHGAPLAVWLGIMLDGIPESLVIGAGMLGILSVKSAAGESVRFVGVVPFTLIAGLFLSNFPEALSSSANMLAQSWTKRRIFLMWFSIMLVAAVGAGVGYLIADLLEHSWVVLFEGVAAGAMLTMIVAAMVPEAVLMGSGNTVGLYTLAGFLAALMFKLLE